MSQGYTAFTLAEVLIVLGIIGVIAEMTIPTVLQNVETQVTVTRLKKAYSNFSQVYNLAVQENGTPESWTLIGLNDGTGANNALKMFAPYLKISEYCGNAAGCWYNGNTYTLNKASFVNLFQQTYVAKARLADGTNLAIQIYNKDCSDDRGSVQGLQDICGEFRVDVNGDKPPNTWAKDVFLFYFSKTGVFPAGTATETSGTQFSSCDKVNGTGTGWGCSGWVIYNGNQDYLKPCGTTLSWSGKTKCD